MSRNLRRGLLALALLSPVALAPVGLLRAQVFPGGHHCCPTCAMPAPQCTCTVRRPVVETRWRREQVVTHRQVPETRVRQEQVVQRVPVTKHVDVEVDEGCYQMVWVPKKVRKRISYVECEERVTTRQVPYTVMKTVPQVSTRLVPERHVRCIEEQVPVQATCPTCPPQLGYAAPATPVVPTATAPAVPKPAVPSLSNRIPRWNDQPAPRTSLSPTPDPAFQTGRSDSSRYGDYDPAPPQEANAARGKFRPAPSAAHLWNSGALR